MSKSRKSKKKAKRRPNLSPLSLLRPRLDGLWGNPDWPSQDEAAQQADLTAVTAGIAPADFLPMMATAYAAAPAPARQSLDSAIPNWIEAENYVDDLQTAVERRTFSPDDLQTAMAWLQATGVETAELATPNTFHDAYLGSDFFGDQGVLALFWYSNYRRSRIRGISILIDYGPPWEGAAKDVIPLSQGPPDQVVDDYLELWEERDIPLGPLDAIEAKQRLIELFQANRKQGIRLHRDFALLRDEFARHIFTLPDGPETPPFTIADFDELTQEGRATESIVIQEQTVGRLVRTEEGDEVVVKRFDPDELLP